MKSNICCTYSNTAYKANTKDHSIELEMHENEAFTEEEAEERNNYEIRKKFSYRCLVEQLNCILE